MPSPRGGLVTQRPAGVAQAPTGLEDNAINVLASAQIAIVIVSADLRIRRFTPPAEKVLNLIPADADRLISHLDDARSAL